MESQGDMTGMKSRQTARGRVDVCTRSEVDS